MYRGGRSWRRFVLGLVIGAAAVGGGYPYLVFAKLTSLTVSERDSLRYHLENLNNEVTLLVKNKKINQFDLDRQHHEVQGIQLRGRIPLKRDIGGLKKELEGGAEKHRLKVKDFGVVSFSKPGPKPPQSVSTFGSPFSFKQDQLAETIYFRVIVNGAKADVKKWVRSFDDQMIRLVKLDREPESKNSEWQIRAHAYRFLDVQFPVLVPRNPRNLLPQWAQGNLQLFAKQEPYLWTLVTQIEETIPQTAPLYRIKSKFLLYDAQMNFFLSKVSHY